MKNRFLSATLIFAILANTCLVNALAVSRTVSDTGELRLTMHRSGAMAETGFAVELTGPAGTRKEVLSAGKDVKETSLTLTELANGSYNLTVAAPGYLTYEQELELDGRFVQLDLYNYAQINAGRTEANGLYGVMPIGDVDRNGVIDDADAGFITAAISGGKPDHDCDLNGDGQVDLADLAISVRNQGGVVLATPVCSVSSAVLAEIMTAAVNPDTTTITSESSNPKDLLDQSKHNTIVGLKNRSGEEISETCPVELTLTVSDGNAAQVSAEALVIAPPAGSDNTIAAGTVTVEAVSLDSKEEFTIWAGIGSEAPSPTPQVVAMAARSSLAVISDIPVSMAAAPASSTQAKDVSVESDGTVVIDLGQRVAIKKVTIRVTATANQGNLAEIAKVQFLSDFSERIPEPQLSIPTVLSVTNTESDGLGYKSLTVTWAPQPNVTGYEVKVSGPGYNKTATTDKTTYTFVGDSLNGTVKAFEAYTITVRSTSGDWKSGWSESYVHTVTCTRVPPAPEYVTAVPGVNSLNVSWTCKFDAETFTLYYKHPNNANFTAVENLTASNYTLQNLQAGVKYTFYVVAHNRNGSSPKSANAEGIPTSPTGVEMPKYKLINVNDSQGRAMSHIVSITGSNDKVEIFGGTDWTVLADNNPASYITIGDWDSGVSYNNFRGPEIVLDQVYTFDTIRFAPFEGETVSIYGAALGYYDGSGTLVKVDASLSAKQDAQGRKYYEIITHQPITASKFQLRTRTFNTAPITMSEVRVYNYDDLEDTVAGLFADDMRTELRDDVTMKDITDLITRAESAIDPVSGEAHPHKATILTDLEYAKALLEHNANADVFTVDNQITANGSQSAAFAQALSDYQPLGAVAAAGDTVVIYVSDGETARGGDVALKLVATQYHPQVSAWQSSAIQLKAGRNEITIPKIGSDATERGGSLYLQYTGAKGAKKYTVRSTGGTYIPVLNVDGITGADRTAAIEAYVAELKDYAAQVETLHGQLHGTDKENASVQYAYNTKNCFLNATEICMDNMMYSLPATEVWKVLNNGNNPAQTLETSLEAMEQEIDYFYQFKGLHKDAGGADAYPYTRLNIRYHQMFTGAFMYAGSKHIGIEFDSTSAVLGLTPITADANGKYQSGNLSGWGIAHEIGHCINSPAYQRVEVTNNVFAQLAKTGGGGEETNANFRADYGKVYGAVATGTTGHTGDLAVQLAMYWQLHLAYDDNYAYKLYNSAEDVQNSLFYARLESFLRGSKAPAHSFTASGGDQLFMQAACAAAGKDILDFFRAWGIAPDTATVDYADSFEKEARKIQYIDDDSRLYRLEGGSGVASSTTVTASITNAKNSRINDNKVVISLGNTNGTDAMLGYEICRNGKMVAFVPAGETSYTDIVTTENNRAFTYTVTGIDKLLNETETLKLDEVKVSHDGSISKDGWTVQTNMTSTKDTVVEKDADDPESGMVSGNTLPSQEKVSAITAALDNDENTVYYGTAGSGNNRPYLLLNLGGVEQVTAVKFTPVKQSYSGDAAEDSDITAGDLYKYRLFGYKVEISLDGASWTTVKEGNAYKTGSAANPSSWAPSDDIIFTGDPQGDGSYILYFNKQLDDGTMDPYLYTYDAAYIRITSTSMSAMAVAEIDVLGPTSDNVELIEKGFGKLKEAYEAGAFADGESCVIPAGSVVFYGEYKGDPSYNVVLLKDQNGKVLDGSQIILAEVAGTGALGATGDGRWLFWLEDKQKTDERNDTYNEMDQMTGLERVQVELYRVQDASTLAGQRLTSTSLTMTIPSVIPEITITGANSTNLYALSPDTIAVPLAAKRDSGEIADPYLGAMALGDTGAAESNTVSPIQLSSDGRRVTARFRPADATNIAAQVKLTLSAAPSTVSVQSTTENSGIYQSYYYNKATGELILFAVARENGLGEITLSADLTPSASCAVTVDSFSVLSNTYKTSQIAGLPDISVEVSQATAPGGNSANTDPGDTGSSGFGDTSNSDPSNADNGSTDGGNKSDRHDSGGGSSSSKPSAATPVETQPSALPFTDVLAGSWYEEAVRFVYENKMMQGTGDGVFDPDLTTSRAMLVTVLYRLFGSPAVETADTFTDVSHDEWYTAAVSWASTNGIVSGYDTEHFGPNDPVTRQQMVAILYRYANYCGYDLSDTADLGRYTDIGEIQPYATDAFVWAVGAGIISGITTETLSPNGNGTRAQIAAILYRFCQSFPTETQGQFP